MVVNCGIVSILIEVGDWKRIRSAAPRRGNRAQRGRYLLVGAPGRHHQRDHRQGRVFLEIRVGLLFEYFF